MVDVFMALLSFRGFDTPSLPAQGEQRRFTYFNIGRDIPHVAPCVGFDVLLSARTSGASQASEGQIPAEGSVTAAAAFLPLSRFAEHLR
jgi:hypothetical protein